MLRQSVYSVTTPESTLAIRIPSRRPDTTIERAVARRAEGARSPTRGSINWGVTVVRAVMNESAEKTAKELVIHSPTLNEDEPYQQHQPSSQTQVFPNALPNSSRKPNQNQHKRPPPKDVP